MRVGPTMPSREMSRPGISKALDTIEERSPGSKSVFVFGFLERARPRFAPDAVEERADLAPCPSCGAPTPAGVCAFCRMQERITVNASRPS